MTFDEIALQIKNSEVLKNTLAKELHKYLPHLREEKCYDFFNGYITEIKTIYGQLERELAYKIEPAPDKWDRLYNVDFFIKIKEKFIGLQIKPVNQGIQLSQIFKEKGLQEKTHIKFEDEFGGKVFYIYSSKDNGKKIIMNPEVIEEIKMEINRHEQ